MTNLREIIEQIEGPLIDPELTYDGPIPEGAREHYRAQLFARSHLTADAVREACTRALAWHTDKLCELAAEAQAVATAAQPRAHHYDTIRQTMAFHRERVAGIEMYLQELPV